MTKVDTTTMASDARAFAEKNVEQARKSFEAMCEATEKMFAATQQSLPQPAQRFNTLALSLMKNNINDMFDITEKVVHASSVDEAMKLQTEFLTKQGHAFSKQFTELNATLGSLTNKKND